MSDSKKVLMMGSGSGRALAASALTNLVVDYDRPVEHIKNNGIKPYDVNSVNEKIMLAEEKRDRRNAKRLMNHLRSNNANAVKQVSLVENADQLFFTIDYDTKTLTFINVLFEGSDVPNQKRSIVSLIERLNARVEKYQETSDTDAYSKLYFMLPEDITNLDHYAQLYNLKFKTMDTVWNLYETMDYNYKSRTMNELDKLIHTCK